jgi:hypothetical protein
MNGKFVVAVVVMFVAWMIEGFVVHAWLLKPEYMKVASLYRPEAEQMPYLPWMLLAHLLIAFAFVWIYVRGKEAKPWLAQGLRYGFLVSLLATTPTYLIYYAVQPLPGEIVVMQIVYDTIGTMLMGIIVAFLYRGAAPATAAA